MLCYYSLLDTHFLFFVVQDGPQHLTTRYFGNYFIDFKDLDLELYGFEGLLNGTSIFIVYYLSLPR